MSYDKDRAYTVLRDVFKLQAFRESQEAVIEHICSGQGDALVLFPTGAGKSLTYQLTAMLLKGVTIVVSPLLALMADQTEALRKKGVDARALSSMYDQSINKRTLQELCLPEPPVKVLFVTPERLPDPHFVSVIRGLDQSGLFPLLCVDEAHCISSWGSDFRPRYREISKLREACPRVAILALTATATEKVQRDILDQLKMTRRRVFRTSFDRPNINYEIRMKDLMSDRHEELAGHIKKHLKADGSAIVYCRMRKTTQEVAAQLTQRGVPAVAYHADLKASDRNKAYDDFMSGRCRCVCATVSFGMGIDAASVRTVVHWDVPPSLEAFYQESGRAGRDGKPSTSILFYSRDDVRTLQFTINQQQKGHDVAKRIERELERLETVVEYCETAESCNRKMLLKHFGETLQRRPGWDKKQCCGFCKDFGKSYREAVQQVLLQERAGRAQYAAMQALRAREEDDLGEFGRASARNCRPDSDDEEAAATKGSEHVQAAETDDLDVARAVFQSGAVFRQVMHRASKPGMSDADRTRAVLKAYVAIESSGKTTDLKRKAPVDTSDDDWEAYDEDDNRLGVTSQRRRKIIREIYTEALDDDSGSAIDQQLLRKVRKLEHAWYTSASAKSEYQALVRDYMDSLHA